jgi:anti-sigma regulatory factor (Ser/Thr protein kinase)
VPLSSQLSLSATPRAASEARRWMSEICRQLDREDLIDCIELGVSELVTNAVLHGAEPIIVRVRGTATHPRVEVFDGSTKAPVPSSPDIEAADDVLSTFGRGLDIVARCALAWGASIEPHGKVVWFEPAPEMHDREDVTWVIDRSEEVAPEPVSADAVPVTLLGLDIPVYRTLLRQYSELRRELRLLSLGHQNDYPLAGNLTTMFGDFEKQFPREFFSQIYRAMLEGRETADVTVRVTPEAARIFVTMGEMFDVADAFCRAERLLSLARTPEQRTFNNWLLGELVRQLEGHAPQPWVRSDLTAPPVESHAQSSSSQVG